MYISNSIIKSAIGLEPVENELLVIAQHLCHFFHRFQVGF